MILKVSPDNHRTPLRYLWAALHYRKNELPVIVDPQIREWMKSYRSIDDFKADEVKFRETERRRGPSKGKLSIEGSKGTRKRRNSVSEGLGLVYTGAHSLKLDP